MDNVLAVILGGGKGTRLYPLTRYRSKPAVPLGGKYRLVDIPVSNCINSDMKKIYVITQYNSESLNRSVFETYKFDIFSRGYIRILAAEQTPDNKDWFQGTADAIRKTIKHLSDSKVEYVVILSGDQLYRMNYKELIRHHIRSDSEVTLALTTVESDKAPAFGLAKIDSQSEITEFVEKPQDPAVIKDYQIPDQVREEQGIARDRDLVLANMGIYVFSKSFLRKLMEETTHPDFGKGIFPDMLGKVKLGAFIHDDYWEDIGTIKAFYEANLDLAVDVPPFNLYDMERPIYAQPLFLPPSKTGECDIQRTLVSDGCIIETATIRQSVIGIRSIIRKNTYIERSYIMGADEYETEDEYFGNGQIPLGIGENCVIKQSIIDKNARIGNNVQIINKDNLVESEGDGYMIRDGIIVIDKGCVIPDGTII